MRTTSGPPLERLGFIALLRLAPWGQGILPHERTFPQAKADRLALLKATGMQDNPIFALFPDAQGEARRLITAWLAREPDAVYRDDDGVLHELWATSDPDQHTALAALLSARNLYIADGHHRYETALAYQAWRREQAGHPREAQPYDDTLVYLTPMDDPGAVILPAHRLVTFGRFSHPDLLTALAADFEMMPLADDNALIETLQTLPAGTPSFGLVLDQAPPVLLRLRPHADQQARLLAAHPASVAALPAAILQTLVLGPCFGISPDPQTQKAQLQFEPRASVAVEHVRAGRVQAALLTTATSMAQLRAIADAGQAAPPKATYFYPKLPSGLVLNQIE